MPQLEHIEAIENRLWSAADELRANSKLASNEYFLPIMGLVFLRHAYSRFLSAKERIEATLPTRGGRRRELTKQDFSGQGAIFLRPEACYDYLVSLPGGQSRADAIINAMQSIEADYESLRDALPKNEYRELSEELLGDMLRTLDPDELKRVSGDVFGRIYEYFLTQFAGLKAHDDGEFFTPISLVSFIANVLEPESGIVLDPACGSGGMFVQSARIVERRHENPSAKLTFRGLEKNLTTIRLARMNLAVHGLEGDIKQAITYYEDPHGLLGKADYVMANPPFNVDKIDAENIRPGSMPFGLPNTRDGRVGNGNYVWISFFHSFLNERGRAGFVMSSQASSAGGGEGLVRQRLVESGAVDIMVAVRSNFFYTRTVPCELWFLNRDKPEEHRDKVLMLDARNVYRKVTRTICDFSPEQEQNLLAVVWLYRGQEQRFLELVAEYCRRCLEAANACIVATPAPLAAFGEKLAALREKCLPFLKTLARDTAPRALLTDWDNASTETAQTQLRFVGVLDAQRQGAQGPQRSAQALHELAANLTPLVEAARALRRAVDQLYKQAARLVECCEKDWEAKQHNDWPTRAIGSLRREADNARAAAVEQLGLVHYFHQQALWLLERFPEAKLRDVPGLVKLVDVQEIAANDYSLTPGRYVGVAPVDDDGTDFAEAMRAIHDELDSLDAEAAELAATIKANFEGLGL